MIVNGIRYGISYLPESCMAYKDGYRYAAYKEDIHDHSTMHITEWFKKKEEIQQFVNKNPEYGKEEK